MDENELLLRRLASWAFDIVVVGPLVALFAAGVVFAVFMAFSVQIVSLPSVASMSDDQFMGTIVLVWVAFSVVLFPLYVFAAKRIKGGTLGMFVAGIVKRRPQEPYA